MVEDAEYRISALRNREEKKRKERKGKENRGKVRKVRGNTIASSHLVLFYPFPSFFILRYSVMTCSIRLANILQFLVKFWFTDYHHFYSHLLEVQMYLPREDRTISTVWQKKMRGRKREENKDKINQSSHLFKLSIFSSLLQFHFCVLEIFVFIFFFISSW